MDYNGARSKAIARLLKKLGVQANFECFGLHQYCISMHSLPCLTLNVWVQRPYLVKGGFQAWSKNLRVKELKPETALTAINEVKRIKTRNSPVNQRISFIMFVAFITRPVSFE
jgi:hypothetical protein